MKNLFALLCLVLGFAWHLGKVALGLAAIGFARVCDRAGFQALPVLGATTHISDLWTPDIWIPGMAETVTTRPSLINSGIVARSPQLDQLAAGGGTQANIPFLREPNYADEIQVEGTAPTVNKLSSGKHVATILNRVSATGHEALAGAVSATDPVQFALNTLAGVRLRQRQTTLLNVVRGAFGNAAAPGAGSAALKSLRKDIFLEAGNSATGANLFSSDAFIDTLALLGEVGDELASRGAIVCHSLIAAAMLKADDIDFYRQSEGMPLLRRYKGMAVYVSDLLTRAGGTNGSVFDTYIFLPGAIAMGDKPQSSTVGDVASLTMKEDESTNTVTIFDRTRFVMHPQGCKWTGTPAGQSATNAELATEGNWALSFADVKNVGIACLRTNG
jgi:hypothetical protein